MRIFSHVAAAKRPATSAVLAGSLVVAGLLTGCAKKEDPSTNINLTPVTLPNGTQVIAESLHGNFEMARGMMFRTSLPADRGMLFVHPKEDKYQYWMFQTKIPLDIVWMDHQHNIVEISPNTPPCTGQPGDCPKYGGNRPSSFVLELNAGMAAKNNLKPGDFIDF